MRAIGIDLGTTNSVAAITDRERPRCLTNHDSELLTPSVVSYFKKRGAETGEIVVGDQAVRNAVRDPANTIFSIKRLMGRSYGEPRVDEVQQRYGFRLAQAPASDAPDQGVRVLLNAKPHTPPEISAMILKQIKADAERVLGDTVSHAVITVPAYFEERQRHATAEAGKLAGLEVLEIIDEPTAAALAFGLGREDERHRVLVYDLGGGTFDISLIQMYKHKYEVLEIQGDNWLGGDDFDQMIVRRMFEWIKSQYSFDPASRPELLMLAKPEAEKAKKALSVRQQTEILWQLKVPDLGMVDVEMDLTREEFEKDIRKKLQNTVSLVHKALDNQALNPSDITAVLLVGGSTAIPLVRTLLADVFEEKKIRVDVNPMQCVALGAAIRAGGHELGDQPQQAKEDPVQRRTAMHLGINTVKGDDPDHFEIIIPKGTPYPLDEPRKTIVKPNKANQRLIVLPIFEGESEEKASLNEPQSELQIPLREGLDPSQDIEIAFGYDRSRILTVWVNIVGKDQDFEFRLEHNRPRPRPRGQQGKAAAGTEEAAAAGNLADDWREGLSHVLKLGKYFWQGYGVFMGDHARKELETAMKEAEEALSTGNQAQGQRAKLAIENILWDSGTASVMFNAETVMQWANAEQTRLLARAIGELRRAHAQQAGGGPTEQFERLEQNVRAVTADIIRERVGPEAAGPKDFGGLLVTPKDL
jgi:molecular chaperone DnaK (HSP70)